MRRRITYDPDRDYYTILGIHTHATPDDIRQAFRQRVRAVHPDLNPDRPDWATAQIQLVNEAYAVLSNPLKRHDYDRLRWPYIRHAPARPAATAAAPPPPDPDRPWWETVVESAPGGYPFSATAPTAVHRPAWLIIADWLKQHHLGALEPTWITLVGLWRSPYATVLAILAIVLALNVALIVYAFREPDALASIEAWFGDPAPTATLPPTAVPTATLAFLAQRCTDPQAEIAVPVSGDVVGDAFSVYGTVSVPELWAFEIDIGYLGMQRRATEPETWVTVRPAPPNQSLAEQPVIAGLLTETPVDLSDQPAGYYALRLRVMRRDGAVIEPCDVIVLH